MLEFLCCHFIGEMLPIIGMELIMSSKTVPLITVSALPNTNLTIENLKISPIDDHLCYGIQGS